MATLSNVYKSLLKAIERIDWKIHFNKNFDGRSITNLILKTTQAVKFLLDDYLFWHYRRARWDYRCRLPRRCGEYFKESTVAEGDVLEKLSGIGTANSSQLLANLCWNYAAFKELLLILPVLSYLIPHSITSTLEKAIATLYQLGLHRQQGS